MQHLFDKVVIFFVWPHFKGLMSIQYIIYNISIAYNKDTLTSLHDMMCLLLLFETDLEIYTF